MTEVIIQIDPVELGGRLRSARVGASFTQDEAASKIGVARTTLVAIEKGERPVRLEELRKLAEIFDQPINRLLQQEFVELDLAGKFRRQRKEERSVSDGQATLNLMVRFATTSVEIERALGIRIRTNYPPEVSIRSGRIQDLADDAAQSVRQHLGIGISPIADVTSLLEIELGIRVFLTALPHTISGAFAFDPTVGACMLVNSSHPKTRRNMTAAHELGHLVGSRREVDLNEEDHVEDTREERFATAFAGAFLMSSAWVRRRFAEAVEHTGGFSPRDLVLISQAAHVSPEGMCRRLETLELLKSGTWESMVDRGFTSRFAKSLLSNRETEDFPVVPLRLAWLAALALEQGLLSEGQLVERLGIDRIRVRQLLDELLTDGDDQVEPLAS